MRDKRREESRRGRLRVRSTNRGLLLEVERLKFSRKRGIVRHGRRIFRRSFKT